MCPWVANDDPVSRDPLLFYFTLQGVLAPIDEVLRQTGVDSSQLGGCLLVGGGSRSHCVQEVLKDRLQPAPVIFGSGCEDLVVTGAAMAPNYKWLG